MKIPRVWIEFRHRDLGSSRGSDCSGDRGHHPFQAIVVLEASGAGEEVSTRGVTAASKLGGLGRGGGEQCSGK